MTGLVKHDVIHVKAKYEGIDGSIGYKNFSLDPEIADFDILVDILSRCFKTDKQLGIDYRVIDDYGEQFFIPLKTNSDLYAAFLRASDPVLVITVKQRNSISFDDDFDIPMSSSHVCNNNRSQYKPLRQYSSGQSSDDGNVFHIPNSNSFISSLSTQFMKTLNNVQRAINTLDSLDTLALDRVHSAPLSQIEFDSFVRPASGTIRIDKLKEAVYRRGMDHAVRKFGWQLILNVFPPDVTADECESLMLSKSHQYESLKLTWKTAYAKQTLTEAQLSVLLLISIDVVRTDRAVFSETVNSARFPQLFNLLATFALFHPEISYHQGMSDLASPILFVEQDEAAAYVCFCALMRRLQSTFADPYHSTLIGKMQHFHDLITHTDPDLAAFLQRHDLGCMYFSQRWLLLELKREFDFNEAIMLLEAQWATVPATHETSNSKSSGGFLTLSAENTHNLFNQTIPSTSHYRVRDLTSINSLVSEQFAVQNAVDEVDKVKRQSMCLQIAERSMTAGNAEVERKSQSGLYANGHRVSLLLPRDELNEVFEDVGSQVEPRTQSTVQPEPVRLRSFVPTLPPPDCFGHGQPFLLFLCLSLLLEYREELMLNVHEASDLLCFFQHTNKQHNLTRIMNRARQLYDRYLSQQDTHA